jgi:hypothetical protein
MPCDTGNVLMLLSAIVDDCNDCRAPRGRCARVTRAAKNGQANKELSKR